MLTLLNIEACHDIVMEARIAPRQDPDSTELQKQKFELKLNKAYRLILTHIDKTNLTLVVSISCFILFLNEYVNICDRCYINCED